MVKYALVTELRTLPDGWSPRDGIPNDSIDWAGYVVADLVDGTAADVSHCLAQARNVLLRTIGESGWPKR